MDEILAKHSGELTILFLGVMLFGALLILVPQLLRAQQRLTEMKHAERLKAIDAGLPIHDPDDRSVFAGRTALLVPMVSVCTAGTVTCFLAAYRTDAMFSVVLAVWTVAGIVSLAAITGCVALMGRLAQLQAQEEAEVSANPLLPR